MLKKARLHIGFTLVELLVVIAIIALLAAILFPVFGRARENARRSSCQSNLKQAGLGMLQYAQDFDEYFPIGSAATASWKMGLGWMGQISPYIKSKQVFVCPSEKGRPNNTPLPGYAAYSYAYNQGLLIKNSNPGYATVAELQLAVKPIAAYTAPTRTVLLCESTYIFQFVDGETSSPVQNGYGQNSSAASLPTGTSVQPGAAWVGSVNPPPIERHLEGSNFLAADGHVKWLTPEQVSYGYAAKASSTAVGTTAPDGAASIYAEGTEYAGTDKHQLTMSWR